MVRRTTWILLAALAVAALAYLGWQRWAPQPAEPTAAAGPQTAWSMTAEQVESIRVTDLANPGVLVVRRDADEGWRMLAPGLGGAEAGRIEAALAGVLAPTVRQSLEGAQDLAAFGLSPARFRLTLLMVDGSAHSMDVGSVDPTGSIYYAALPGDGRVLMISRFDLEDLLGLMETPPYPPPTATATVLDVTGTP